ncbi:MAG: Smr/MutS family protein [Deltaproteobacteria bacterium]|nr:MAG: Smr/MutS family protein [Deltaproteobacteria bacterium]
MKKRRRSRASGSEERPRSHHRANFNTPFAELGDMLRRARADTRAQAGPDEVRSQQAEGKNNPTQRTTDSGPEGDDRIFWKAMTGVEPLSESKIRPRTPRPRTRPYKRPLVEEELEAYAQLVDLVSGEGRFDIQYTDEYMEGAVVGAGPEILEKLRLGTFSIQAHLDLHGMTADEARQALEEFILVSVMKGLRCILIIHGRGLNSRDQIPILKQRMANWLKSGRLKRCVLAFTTARSCDGGAGALYVLLRKSMPEGMS